MEKKRIEEEENFELSEEEQKRIKDAFHAIEKEYITRSNHYTKYKILSIFDKSVIVLAYTVIVLTLYNLLPYFKGEVQVEQPILKGACYIAIFCSLVIIRRNHLLELRKIEMDRAYDLKKELK